MRSFAAAVALLPCAALGQTLPAGPAGNLWANTLQVGAAANTPPLNGAAFGGGIVALWPTGTTVNMAPPIATDADTTLAITNNYLNLRKTVTTAGSGFATLAVGLDFNKSSAGAVTVSPLVTTATAEANVGSASVSALTSTLTNAANTGGQSYGAFISNNKSGRTGSFGAAIVCTDITGQPSSTQLASCKNEIDSYANGADDDPAGQRQILGLVYGKALVGGSFPVGPMTVHVGLYLGVQGGSQNNNSSADRLLRMNGTINVAGLDLRDLTEASSSAHSMWMSSDQTFAVNTLGTATLRFDSSTTRWKYAVGGVDLWSIDTSGNVRAKGTITGSTTP